VPDWLADVGGVIGDMIDLERALSSLPIDHEGDDKDPDYWQNWSGSGDFGDVLDWVSRNKGSLDQLYSAVSKHMDVEKPWFLLPVSDDDDDYDPDYDDHDDKGAADPDFLLGLRISIIRRKIDDKLWSATYKAASNILRLGSSENKCMHELYLSGHPILARIYECHHRDDHWVYLGILNLLFRTLVGQLIRMLRAVDPELPTAEASKYITEELASGPMALGMEKLNVESIWGVQGNVRRPGRPRKIAMTTPQARRAQPQTYLDEAWQASQRADDGWTWEKIARSLWPDLPLTDPRQRENIRGRVRTRIHRGNILRKR
jgi:hypothetical protein